MKLRLMAPSRARKHYRPKPRVGGRILPNCRYRRRLREDRGLHRP